MDVGKIEGQSGYGRHLDRSGRSAARQSAPARQSGDSASISTESAKISAKLDALLDDGDRETFVRAAQVRLESGQLDTREAFEATAERLLGEL